MDVPFSQIPNHLIRSPNYSVYDFRIYCCIASCGDQAFPGYPTLMRWCGISRDQVWKSLRRLEKGNLIQRYLKGRKIYYRTYYNDTFQPDDSMTLVKYSNGPSGGLSTRGTVRGADYISPSGGLLTVRPADPIKNSYKELTKKNLFSTLLKEIPKN